LTASRRNDVDVVVLDLDGGSMLDECLTSIERQTVRPGRVIVWDNGSRIAVSSRVSDRDGVEVFRSETNLGFAAGMNAALRESTAPYVALANNDVTLGAGWIAALAAEMDRAPKLGGVQTVILGPDGRVDGAGIDVSNGTIRQRGHGLSQSDLSGSVWGVSATAVLFRREALDQVARGGAIFDESLFAYYEDVELCARLKGAGWELRVLPEPLAVHRGSSSAGALGRRALRLRVRNRWIVHRRHPAVGRATALLAEDCREILKSLTHLKVGDAMARFLAVIEGLATRLR
jgi:GT2 family glycosyltransferase